jgi:hypothetical protein
MEISIQVGQFLLPEGREAGIAERRGHGHLLHRRQQGLGGLQIADAAPEAAVPVRVTKTPRG